MPKNPAKNIVPTRRTKEQDAEPTNITGKSDTDKPRLSFGSLLPFCCNQAVASDVRSPRPSHGLAVRSSPSDNYRWTVRPKEKKHLVKRKSASSHPAADIPKLRDVVITITEADDEVSPEPEATTYERITDELRETAWSEDYWNQLTAIPGVLVDPSEEPVPPPAIAKSITKPKLPTANKKSNEPKERQISQEPTSLMVSDMKAEKKLRQKERKMAEKAKKERAAKAKETKKQAKEAKKQKKLQKKAEKAAAKAKAKENRKKRAKRNAIVPTSAPAKPRALVKPPTVAPIPVTDIEDKASVEPPMAALVQVTDWAVSKKPAVSINEAPPAPPLEVCTTSMPHLEAESSELIAVDDSEASKTDEEEDKYWETNTVRVTICPKPIVFSNKQIISEPESVKEVAKPHFTRPKGAHHNSVRSVTKDMSHYNNLRRQLVQDTSLPIQKVDACKKNVVESCQCTDECDDDSSSEFDFEEAPEKSQAPEQQYASPEKRGQSKVGFESGSSATEVSPSSGTLEKEACSLTAAELAQTQSEHCYSNPL